MNNYAAAFKKVIQPKKKAAPMMDPEEINEPPESAQAEAAEGTPKAPRAAPKKAGLFAMARGGRRARGGYGA